MKPDLVKSAIEEMRADAGLSRQTSSLREMTERLNAMESDSTPTPRPHIVISGFSLMIAGLYCAVGGALALFVFWFSWSLLADVVRWLCKHL